MLVRTCSEFRTLVPVLAFFAGAGLYAQRAPFYGVVRGIVLECDAPGPSGEFRVRAGGTDQVYRFKFDSKTYVERDDQRISMAGIEKGDAVEVVSDRDAGLAIHYARTVHVINPRPVRRQVPFASRNRTYSPPFDLLAPRGDLTFTGIVDSITLERLVLHLRSGARTPILLRRDTRFIAEGEQVDAAELKPSTRVFVRAGKNLDDRIEAYQIMWGEILEPSHTH